MKRNSRSKKLGLAPGTIVHLGQDYSHEIKILLTTYNEKEYEEKHVGTLEECFPIKKTNVVTWIHIDGIHDIKIIEQLGKLLDLHPLLLEDVANSNQIAKFESFDDHDYLVAKHLYYNSTSNEVKSEQISLILGDNYLVSFTEKPIEIFNPIRERIRNGKGKIRRQTPDYLLYTLMDAIVDNYFVLLEQLGEKIEELDEELVSGPSQETMKSMHRLKREVVAVRRAVWPLREVVRSLQAEDHPLVEDSTQIYLRDLLDHVIQVIDIIETYRDLLSEMLDVYLSTLSNKVSEVMKVLTIDRKSVV